VSPRGSSSTPSSTQNGRATGSPARSGISNHDRPEEEGSHLPGLRAPVASGGPEMQPVVRLASWLRLRPGGLGAGCLRVYGRAVAQSARAGRCGATTSIRCRAWPRAAESRGDDQEGRCGGHSWLMDRRAADGPRLVRPSLGKGALSWGFAVERVTGIEPALSAWELYGAAGRPLAVFVTWRILMICP
jgi:hypothetical protein